MKRISIIILLAFALMSAKAQTAAQKACMQEARDAYAVAMKSMEEAQEIPELDCSFHVTKKRNFPGSGPQTYSIDYFCNNSYDEEAGGVLPLEASDVYFIRVHYNWAARQYTYEYVLDGKGGVLFVYQVCDGDPSGYMEVPEGAKFESRMYFSRNGAFCYGYQQAKHSDGKVTGMQTLNGKSLQVVEQQRLFKELMATFKCVSVEL